MSRFHRDPLAEHVARDRDRRVVDLYARIGYPGTPKRAAWLAEQRGEPAPHIVDRDPGDESEPSHD